VVAGETAVLHFDARDFDDTVALGRVQAGGFGIEDYLAHGAGYSWCWRKRKG